MFSGRSTAAVGVVTLHERPGVPLKLEVIRSRNFPVEAETTQDRFAARTCSRRQDAGAGQCHPVVTANTANADTSNNPLVSTNISLMLGVRSGTDAVESAAIANS